MSEVKIKLICYAPLGSPNAEGYCCYPLVKQLKDTARTLLYYGVEADYTNSTLWYGYNDGN